MKTPALLALFTTLSWPLFAQTASPAAAPQEVAAPAPQLTMPAPTPVGTTSSPAPLASPVPATSSIPAVSPAPVAAEPAPSTIAGTPAPQPAGGIRFNFQNAQLSDVLSYLSEAAGFVIVQDEPVSGTVNIISRQPLTPDEAVDMLNSVLIDKNYIALRNGRILKIVSRTDAQKRDLPVVTGADPALIPRNDNMVTQILPVRYADVSKLIDNLRPLLSDDATMSANDASNAIILTDTEANVRRIAEIIRALDTSISGISTIRVYPLQYADAKSLADVLNQLFPNPQSNQQGTQGLPPFLAAFARRMRGGGGGGGESQQPQSAARNAASRVIAVADTQSNSVVVAAPDEYISTITDIITRLDTNGAEVSETRIFHLDHADSTEMTNILMSLYSESTPSGNSHGNNQHGAQPPPPATERAFQETHFVAVPDPRTNSVIVSCSHDMMEDIALTVGKLDSTDSKKQHIHVYTLENADPDNVASILRGMFTANGQAEAQTQPTTDVLEQRTQTGASSDVINTLNTSGNGGSGGNGNNGYH